MEPLTQGQLQQQGFIRSPRQLQGQIGKRFTFINKIGQGSYGMVALVHDKYKDKKVALKMIKFDKKSQGIPPFALRQISILKSLDHPNIVKIQNVFYDYNTSKMFFTMQLHHESLSQFIKNNHPIGVNKIKNFTFHMLNALQFLHRKGYMHRDIKPQNFIITHDNIIRLCDFGQAKILSLKKNTQTLDVSTLWYKAPQILMGYSKYDQKVDVWAAGCIIVQMLVGKPLFNASSQIGMLFSIFNLLGTPKQSQLRDIDNMKYLNPKYPKFKGQGLKFQGISTEAQDLINKMLIIIPQKRPSIKDILRHQFFDDLLNKN